MSETLIIVLPPERWREAKRLRLVALLLDIVGKARRELIVDGRYFDLHVMERHFKQP